MSSWICRLLIVLRGGRISACLWFVAVLLPVPAHAQLKTEKLADGVEHWYVAEPPDGPSYLGRKLAELYHQVFPKEPFGRSIALLVGVSEYRNLPALPSVRNDITNMRDFLLNKAGFDEVYVATDDIVNRDLIEQYIKGVIASKTTENDRLLFYYSGHGGDGRGKTGYMMFGNAQRGMFWGPHVLAIDTLSDWSHEVRARHALFIVDSCVSGLAFTAKSPPDASDQPLLLALSGNGSRTVLTAGLADEEAYADEGRQSAGGSVFTLALLHAFELKSSTNIALITITDLFDIVEKEMANFRAHSGKATTPGLWRLQETDYRGTFVFLNAAATAAHLTSTEARALGVAPISKSGDDGTGVVASGVIDVFSGVPGALYIDNVGGVVTRKGESKLFEMQSVGLHHLRFLGTATEEKDLVVEAGKVAYAAFGLQSPIDATGKVPIGSLVLDSTGGLSGDVYIDGQLVGHLGESDQLTVSGVVAGAHSYRIVGRDAVDSGPMSIVPGQTFIVSFRPEPPTGLTAEVR